MPSVNEINQFLENDFPQCRTRVKSIEPQFARVQHKVVAADLRPGGTVSGPCHWHLFHSTHG
jgi:hypothetical protein